uniref:FAD-binding PCMH-type domain-containing protein n=2 Tax=Caenorhabditis japonica TaxID=281687 RepID=A0A8R1DVT0_CAEJA
MDPGGTFIDYYTRVFHINNETINIWSHLLGFIYFTYQQYYTNCVVLPSIGSHPADHIVFTLSIFGMQICMFLSASYHTFGCSSIVMRQKWLKMDVFGISAGLLGMYLNGIYTAFFCFQINDTNGCGMGENCCKVKKSSSLSDDATPGYTGGERKRKLQLSSLSDCAPYDATQEIIFPPELKHKNFDSLSFAYDHHHTKWYQPVDYDDLLTLKRELPHARLISGNSELAIELKFRFIDLPVLINPKQVKELYVKRVEENGVYMGTGMSLTDMDRYVVKLMNELTVEQVKVLQNIHEMLHWFAGTHVRNVASVSGNIATASPISDLNPIWMAANAQVVLDSADRGERRCCIDENFFLGYRKTCIRSDEVIKAVVVPLTTKNEHFAAYKQAQRREDDIAIVTGAFFVKINPDTFIVEKIRIAFGGMAPTTKLTLTTMSKLEGQFWSQGFLDQALSLLSEEMKLPAGVPGGMSQYRLSLALSFFFKFFLKVSKDLNFMEVQNVEQNLTIGNTIPKSLNATQVYQEVNDKQKYDDPVGRPLKHVSGDKHTTGEAVYCDDINVADCLHIAFVTSPIAHGTLNSIDYTAALHLNGVIGYIDAYDVYTGAQIGHHNDTPVFVKDEITFHGQPIAAIVATDHEIARKAASLVKLDTAAKKPIVTIKQALEADSFIFKHFVIHSSLNDNETVVKNDWSKYERVVEGSIDMGGQEHFYLETQQCIVIPHEDDELEIIISNQCVNDVHIEVAKCLGIAQHKISTTVKRIGGGFGGKESTGAILAVPASLAARKFNKPMKLKLERFDDMAITGTRHPFTLQYKLAVDENGKFIDLDYTAISNSGHTMDLSMGVMQRAMVHADNVYKFGNADITGKMCKTHLASNTAFRGFGGPQGMFGTEIMVKHVAEQFNWDHDEIREKNFYQEGDCTPFGMHLNQCNVTRTWKECKTNSDYCKRLEEVKKFNSENKFRKRGIYLTPTRFGIGFGLKQLNQAGALVLVYTDGSVLVSHGGMEMGQGLHTKILQIAARCLEIPIEKVHIRDTATDKVPNSSATAASVGSDLNGLAVQDACRQILERLEPFKKENPEGGWLEWVNSAYVNRVSLSASGFGIIHHEPVDFFNGKGAELFGYSVYGTAACEVEVDCLTGDHHLLRTDIVMDVGESLNPAIDIGQIEGAFIQGYGLFTMEEIKIRPDGIRLTRGPGTYKIPSADDVPKNFNVSLLGNSSNKMGIFSSKAIGEPPLFLGSCAFFAIREAVRAYRVQNGKKEYFVFNSPSTPERIRMACEDFVTQHVPALPEEGSYTPWTASV